MRNIIFIFLLAISYKASANCSFNGGPFISEGNVTLWVDTKPVLNNGETIFVDIDGNIFCSHVGKKPSGGGGGGGIGGIGPIGDVNLFLLEEARVSSFFGQSESFVEFTKYLAPYRFRLPVLPNSLAFSTIAWVHGLSDFGLGPGNFSLGMRFLLKPKDNVPSIPIYGGDEIAFVKFSLQIGNNPKKYYSVRIVSTNSIVIPTGGCDVSARNINVVMGDYPLDTSPRNINLRVRCPGTPGKNVKFSLSGRTDSPTIFSNISTNSPASGIGVEIMRNGSPLRVNTDVGIGVVDASEKDLNISAKYALNGKPLRTGNFQSVISVNFTYN